MTTYYVALKLEKVYRTRFDPEGLAGMLLVFETREQAEDLYPGEKVVEMREQKAEEP